MSFETFIGFRLIRGKKRQFSRPIVRIALISVALGLACMIVSVAIVTGFQQAIRDKIVGFGSHIQVTRFDQNMSFEQQPVTADQSLIDQLSALDGIRHVQVFATKPGIIKTRDQIEGIVLRGVDDHYDWSFFQEKIVAGEIPAIPPDSLTNRVLVSRYLASRLLLSVGDPLRMYFIQEGEPVPRARRLQVSGIYETGLGELDHLFVLCDIRVIRRLNGWSEDQVGGFEIHIRDFEALDEVGGQVYKQMGYELNAQTIRDLYPQLFEWLKLMDMNVLIILVLMTVVSAMAMISALLILVLEQTTVIGILKALGGRNYRIRRIFLLQAGYILLQGLAWGNIAGLGISLAQRRWNIIGLNADSYYVSTVPIHLDAWHILALNAGTLLMCLLLMLLPSFTVTRISPIRTIRYQ